MQSIWKVNSPHNFKQCVCDNLTEELLGWLQFIYTKSFCFVLEEFALVTDAHSAEIVTH